MFCNLRVLHQACGGIFKALLEEYLPFECACPRKRLDLDSVESGR
jgi:hypothetical protein